MAGIRRKATNAEVEVTEAEFEKACIAEQQTRMMVMNWMSEYTLGVSDNDETTKKGCGWTVVCHKNVQAVRLMIMYAEQHHMSYAEYQDKIRDVQMKSIIG